MPNEEKRWLIRLIFLGAILRIAFVLKSQHLFYPDELFQTLEQSYRLVHGYSIIPWDYAYQIRSWFIPFIFAIPLWISTLLHLSNPTHYTKLVELAIAFSSLTLIPTLYLLAKKTTQSEHIAKLASFAAAIWYEFIYFAPRALTETLATTTYSLCLLLLLTLPKAKQLSLLPTKETKLTTEQRLILAGFLLGLATLMRPQYILVTVAILFWQLQERSQERINRLAFGFLSSVLLVGITDLITYKQFLISFVNNYRYSFKSGVSQAFGTKPASFYLESVVVTSGGLALLILPNLKNKQLRILNLSLIALLAFHSLFAHKEYRFVYITLPLMFILIAHALSHLQKYSKLLPYLLVSILSILGMLHYLPGQKRLYTYHPLQTDPSFTLLHELHTDPNLCGLYDTSRQWVYQGSYYHLGTDVPIYSQDYPPPSPEVISHLLSTDPELKLDGFAKTNTYPEHAVYWHGKAEAVPKLHLYKASHSCTTDPNYSYNRSLAPIDAILEKTH